MINLDEGLLTDLSSRLLEAERTRTALSPLTDEHPSLSMDDAYLIQERLVRTQIEAGCKVIGWKAGFTSEAMRQQMNVGQPNRGYLLDYMLCEGMLDLDNLIHPRVEPEVAFIMDRDLRGPGLTADDVLAATRWLCPALEIVDSRFRDYKFRVEDNTSDNSSAARLVLGERVRPDAGLDLAAVGVVLEKNGLVEQTGSGEAAFGHPASSVAWLANQLSESGQQLEAGQIVLSGGLTAAPYIRHGDHVTARLEGLGSVEVRA